ISTAVTDFFWVLIAVRGGAWACRIFHCRWDDIVSFVCSWGGGGGGGCLAAWLSRKSAERMERDFS
ncbi:unnamed protein product, partial [Ectocarpus sp. 12 AP-2014]